ncbi:HNH endonuclease signature motif containing protein [Dactylosporangium darangshiense]|uniref:HNH nuclease domain-containing protein n=1 Tax=Dactylosporangium darangshiense TaxID=579108 RepID=A0ABP8DAB0_9ACTN
MDATAVAGPLTEALESLAGLDLETLDDPAVRDSLLALLRCQHRLDAVIGRFVGAFDDRRLSHKDGFGTTRQWLVGFGRLSGPAAGGRMRATEVTRLLPELAQAFEAGEVSAEHVNRIGITAEEVGDEVIEQAEHTLVELAQNAGPEHLHEACGHLRDLALADKSTPPEEQYRRRGVTLTRLGDMWRLRGVLDTETGALFGTALDAFTKPPGQGDDRSPAQRRHDAAADMLNAVLRSGQAPEVAGGRPCIGLLMPVRRYLRLHDHSGTEAEETSGVDGRDAAGSVGDDGGQGNDGAEGSDLAGLDSAGDDGAAVMSGWGPVSDALAARLSCDATLQQLWLHPVNGVPLKLGRSYRNTPWPLRRALAARDPHCRWPGCRIPANWCDSHHLREWIRDNGETDVDNLVLLCRYHHVCMHERGWQMFREPRSGWVWIMRPDGRRYELGPSRPRVDAKPPGEQGDIPEPITRAATAAGSSGVLSPYTPAVGDAASRAAEASAAPSGSGLSTAASGVLAGGPGLSAGATTALPPSPTDRAGPGPGSGQGAGSGPGPAPGSSTGPGRGTRASRGRHSQQRRLRRGTT